MKTRNIFFTLAILVVVHTASAAPAEGFFLPDSIKEVTFKYKSVNNLIVLPVRINDNEIVNLVLDTGCRNLILFGKRFRDMIGPDNREIIFSGLGTGKPAKGYVTLENHVTFSKVTGKRIPIVVVPERNVFANYPGIHGIIGYELFMKFEVEINFAQQQITFRPAMFAFPPAGFHLIPLRIEDSRPIVSCVISFDDDQEEICDLLIDTGSSLGLLFTAPQPKNRSRARTVLGRGVNGYLSGQKLVASKVTFGNFSLHDLPAGVVTSNTHHYASLGTEVLKDFTLLINYHKSYAGLRQA